MRLCRQQPFRPARRQRLPAEFEFDDRAQQHEARLAVHLAARPVKQAARERELAGARREHRLEIIETRIAGRSEEHTSELQSLMRSSYAVFCLKKKKTDKKEEIKLQNTI